MSFMRRKAKGIVRRLLLAGLREEFEKTRRMCDPYSIHYFQKKLVNLEHVIDDYNNNRVQVTGRPLRLFVEFANACNLRCKMCSVTYWKGSGLMSSTTLERVEPLFGHAITAILNGDGESMLHPQFIETIEKIKRFKMYSLFSTNATLLDKDMATALVKNPVITMRVSFDGATPKTYEYFRIGSSFDTVIDNIKRFVETKRQRGAEYPKLEFILVLMRQNYNEVPAYVQLAKDVGADSVAIKLICGNIREPQYEAMYEQHKIPHEEIPRARESLMKSRTLAERLKIPYLVENDIQNLILDTRKEESPPIPNDGESSGQRRTDKIYCTEPFRTVFVRANGDVRTCCNSPLILGNLNEQSFDEIWNGEAYQNLRRLVYEEPYNQSCLACVKNFRFNLTFENDWKTLDAVSHL